MKRIGAMIAILVVTFSALVRAEDAASPPRVFLLDGQQLQRSRQRLRNGDRSLAPALEQLKNDTADAMKRGPWSVMDKDRTPPSGDKHDYMSQGPYWWPNPDTADHLPYIRRDGERNPEIYKISDEQNLAELTETVQTLSLAYYFSGDEAYANKAADLLRVWFIAPDTRMNPNLNFGQGIPGITQGRGIGIIETAKLSTLLDSIGLLGGSKAWSDADQRAMEKWFGDYLHWLLTSNNGQAESAAKNNHGTYYDLQTCTFALFVGQDDVARKILQSVGEKRIARQIEPDGSQPLELARTKSWSYSVMNLRGLMLLAGLGDRAGVDLWNFKTDDGRSIRKALEFLTPFSTGEKKWQRQQLGGFEPQILYPLLRRAAMKWPDAYQPIVAKLPPIEPADITNLTGATLLTTNKRTEQHQH